MKEVLAALLGIAVPVFSVASMLGVGFAHSLRDLLRPLRNVAGVARVLLANFILIPLLAYGIIRVSALDPPLAIGLFLLGAAAGAPFLIKLTARAEHDVGFSATILVLLIPATVIYLPVVLPRVLPEAEVEAWAIAKPLLLTLMLPLGAGLLLRASASGLATRLLPLAQRTASVALLTLVALTVWLNFSAILGLLGSGAIAAAASLVIGAFAIGYAVGGRTRQIRGVLGLAAAQRNVAAATIVATRDFEDRRVLVMVVITSLVALAILFPIASWLKRRINGHHGGSDQLREAA